MAAVTSKEAPHASAERSSSVVKSVGDSIAYRSDNECDDGGDEEEQERFRQVLRGYRTSCGEKTLWSQQESHEVDRVVGNELEILKHVSHNILPVFFNTP